MIQPEILDKLDNIAKAVRQSNQAKNNGEVFVREMLKRAKDGKITDIVPPEQVEAYAAVLYLSQFTKTNIPLQSEEDRANEITQLATDRRNHKLMLKLMRHYEEDMRAYAASRFQIVFAMLDGYFDEASSLINQILLLSTESPRVKAAFLEDMGQDVGHSSKRGSPRGIVDTVRQLINDVDQVVSYHALRVLTAMYDVRDWKTVLERMVSLVGEEDAEAEYFLSAGVEYLQIVLIHYPDRNKDRLIAEIADWMKSLIDTYPTSHRAMKSLEKFVLSNPEVARDTEIIDKRTYAQLTNQ